jgi:hypothetical protein
MYLDKQEKPLGLKITNFITTNLIWYLIFSLIYWDYTFTNWWLIQNAWGRLILLFLEYSIIISSFNETKNEKS